MASYVVINIVIHFFPHKVGAYENQHLFMYFIHYILLCGCYNIYLFFINGIGWFICFYSYKIVEFFSSLFSSFPSSLTPSLSIHNYK